MIANYSPREHRVSHALLETGRLEKVILNDISTFFPSLKNKKKKEKGGKSNNNNPAELPNLPREFSDIFYPLPDLNHIA